MIMCSVEINSADPPKPANSMTYVPLLSLLPWRSTADAKGGVQPSPASCLSQVSGLPSSVYDHQPLRKIAAPLWVTIGHMTSNIVLSFFVMHVTVDSMT